MITRTVKIPKTLVDRINSLIESGDYSTRADFILHALRHTVTTYVDKKLEAMSTRLTIGEKEINEIYAGMTSTYLKGFLTYSGEQIQINTRVPEGLERKVLLLVKEEYGFKKKADFTRAAIICLLSKIDQIESMFEDAEKLILQQKEMMELLKKVVIEGVQEGLTPKEIIDNAYERLQNSNNSQRLSENFR